MLKIIFREKRYPKKIFDFFSKTLKIIYVMDENEDSQAIEAYLTLRSDVDFKTATVEQLANKTNFKFIGEIKIGKLRETYWLIKIGVDEDYRRCGIATKLIKLSLKNFEKYKIACLSQKESSFYALTVDGEKLMIKLANSGLLPIEMFVLPNKLPRTIIRENSSNIHSNRLDGYIPALALIRAVKQKQQHKQEGNLPHQPANKNRRLNPYCHK